MSVARCVLDVLEFPSNSSMGEYPMFRLQQIGSLLQLEFVMLFDSQGEVLLAPNNVTQRGSSFDPALIVSQTIATGVAYTRTGLVSFGTVDRFNAPDWDGRASDLPHSVLGLRLQPTVEALVRWTTVPVHLSEPAIGDPPDGV